MATDYSGLAAQLRDLCNDSLVLREEAAAALEEMAWLEWALEHGWRLLFEPDFDRYGLLSPDGVVFNGVLLGEAIQKARESEK